jgi:hypothetical protein
MSFTKIFENIVELAKENLELKETIIKQNELIIEDKLELIKRHKEIREIKNGMVVKNRQNKDTKENLQKLCSLVKNTRYDGIRHIGWGNYRKVYDHYNIRKAKNFITIIENNIAETPVEKPTLFGVQGVPPFSQPSQERLAPPLPPPLFVKGDDPNRWDNDFKHWVDESKHWVDESKRWSDNLDRSVNESRK